MSTHAMPEGEAERHFPCPGCHCRPWEYSTPDEAGEQRWFWFHERLGDKRKRRFVDGVE